MVPNHSLLKYFTLTFTRHKSSKFDGSGPPLRGRTPLFRNIYHLTPGDLMALRLLSRRSKRIPQIRPQLKLGEEIKSWRLVDD